MHGLGKGINMLMDAVQEPIRAITQAQAAVARGDLTRQELFAKYGYAESEEHIKEHEMLKSQAMDLKAKMDTGDFMIGVEVLAFLKEWLANHILKADKAYSDFLVSKGVT